MRKTPVEHASVAGVVEDVKRDKKTQIRRRRKRSFRKIFKFFVVIIIGVLLFKFDQSKISRVQEIQVVNNSFVEPKELLKKIEVSEGERLFLVPSFVLQHRAKRVPGVAQADINVYYTKGLVHVNITEKQPLFAVLGKTATVYFDDRSFITVDPKHPGLLNVPIMTTKGLEELTSKYFRNFSEIDKSVMMAISELSLTGDPLDPTRTKFLMNGGYIVYANTESLPYLNQYDTIRKAMKPEDGCIEFTNFGPSPDKVTAISRPCNEQDH